MRGQITEIQRQKQIITRLQNENNKLRERVKILEAENLLLKSQFQDVMMQLEHLKKMIFGEKKSKNDEDKKDNGDNRGNGSAGSGGSRGNKSYRRPVPDESEITDVEEFKIDNCPECGSRLTKKETAIRFIEDIQLAVNELIGDVKKVKKITKQIIEKGYCPHCRKWFSAIPVPSQTVMIGSNAKQFIAYSINVLRLTYEQTENILKDLYKFEISDGETAKILEEVSHTLYGEFEKIKKRILEALSAHLDETGWQTGNENNYAWVLASGDTEEAVFVVGKSRGKGNAEDLLKGFNGVRISDCYAAYKNLKGSHQVCWAHIIRKARDLADSDILEKDKKEFSKEIYFDLQSIFKDLKDILESEFNKEKRLKILPDFYKKLETIIDKIQTSKIKIKKLTDLANTMEKYKKQLFTCIIHKGVSPTNNKAEQKLRHLVLKRKNSFGTKSDKGNQILSINMSVILSTWWQNRDNFFQKFNQLLTQTCEG